MALLALHSHSKPPFYFLICLILVDFGKTVKILSISKTGEKSRLSLYSNGLFVARSVNMFSRGDYLAKGKHSGIISWCNPVSARTQRDWWNIQFRKELKEYSCEESFFGYENGGWMRTSSTSVCELKCVWFCRTGYTSLWSM